MFRGRRHCWRRLKHFRLLLFDTLRVAPKVRKSPVQISEIILRVGGVGDATEPLSRLWLYAGLSLKGAATCVLIHGA